MQKILSAEEMREVDRLTTEKYGIPSILLMENAAHAAARVITEKLGGEIAGKSFLILCGKGNNGGDGAALARILWQQGAKIQVNFFGDIEETKGDARVNFEIAKKVFEKTKTNVKLWFYEYNLEDWIDEFGFSIGRSQRIVIDALFGTGLTKKLKGQLSKLSQKAVKAKTASRIPYLISLDIPSGLNADIYEQIGENIQADLTVTFTAPKLANVFPPASNFNGELIVANIGSPQELIDNSPSRIFLAEKQDASDWLHKTEVRKDSYKKTRGTCLIVAGSDNFSGAAVLAANACFSAGAGMVSVAVPQTIKEIVASKTADEIIVKTLENTKIEDEKVDVIALGCGLASGAATKKLVRETVKNRNTPIILDAEALNALAPFDLQGSDELPLILTPHISEFKRLLGTDEEITDKIAAAREFAENHNVILVLKGERSLIAKPDGTVVINPTGNAGISRAGSGDTLTGIITSFLAQTFAVNESETEDKETNSDKAFRAVVSALYIAGSAGDIAAKKFGQRLMTASDIRDCLAEATFEIDDREKFDG